MNNEEIDILTYMLGEEIERCEDVDKKQHAKHISACKAIRKKLKAKRKIGNIQLYYHKTDGGAEYLMDTFIPWKHEGKSGKEGTITDQTSYIVRIDGDITKDAELIVK